MDWKTTACPHDCPDGCAMKALYDGTRIRMAPNRALPWSSFLCGKGLRWREKALHPTRLLRPLLRDGNGWKEISWEQAWSLWSEKMQGALEKWGPLSLMFYQSAGSLFFSKQLLPHFFAALGGMTSPRGNLCSSAGSRGLKDTFGEVPVQLPETCRDHSQGVLLWGRNAWECHAHFVPVLQKIRERGGEVATLEIRGTTTTRHADRSWRIRPGSDAFLAAWLCRELLNKHEDSPFWGERTINAENLRQFLLSLDTSETLAPTGLLESDAEELFDWILDHRPLTHCPGFGIQRYLHGDLAFSWIGTLAVMLGAFDTPGAGLVFSKDEMAKLPPALVPPLKESRRLPISTWHRQTCDLHPPLEVLVLSGADPLKQAPDSSGIAGTFEKIPFKVCLDLFMSETAAASDLVLPVASFLEQGGDWRGSYWHNYLVRTERVIPLQGMVLPETSIFTGVARAMGLSVDLDSLARYMDRILLADPEIHHVAEGIFRWDEPEFWSRSSATCRAPKSLPPGTPQPETGVLRLVSVHSRGYINGQNQLVPGLNSVDWAALHPAEAARRGLREGALVVLEGTNGHKLVRRIKLDGSISRDCCLITQGLPDVNLLTPALSSPGSGAPFHETWVKISLARD